MTVMVEHAIYLLMTIAGPFAAPITEAAIGPFADIVVGVKFDVVAGLVRQLGQAEQ